MERKDFRKRYLEKAFENNPEDDLRRNIHIIYDKKYKDDIPFFSVVTPIYNQEKIIVKNIQKVLECMSEKTYEIIFILDCCSDKTEECVLQFLETCILPELLVSILILKSDYPLFETSADNLGFYCSRGNYILEIQADMEIQEKGFNMKLLKPFIYKKNVIGVSGRGCINLSYLVNESPYKIIDKINYGENYKYIDKFAFYIGETCNRGPLLLDREKVEEMKYFDEKNYFLDNSDHDLFCRAFVKKGYICGHTYIDFKAPLEDGSTRRPRDQVNTTAFLEKKSKSMSGFLESFLFSKYTERNIEKVSFS